MIDRRPPSAPLFPYTTLFRSERARGVRLARRERVVGVKERLAPVEQHHVRAEVERMRARGGIALDRKSTRLNSSHGYISYAVFCLKKKKQTRIRPPAPISSRR